VVASGEAKALVLGQRLMLIVLSQGLEIIMEIISFWVGYVSVVPSDYLPQVAISANFYGMRQPTSGEDHGQRSNVTFGHGNR